MYRNALRLHKPTRQVLARENPPPVIGIRLVLQRLSLLEGALLSMQIVDDSWLEHAFRELVICYSIVLLHWDLCELLSGLSRPIVRFLLELLVETGEVELAVLRDLALPALWHGQLEATHACLLCERQVFE